MRNLMDNLENAAFKLHDMGKKAFENAKPSLRQSLDDAWNACEAGAEKAVESARNACERARPNVGDSIDRAFESAKSACERAVDGLRSALDDLADSPEEPPKDSAEPDEAVDLDVEETLAQIQNAKSEPNIISDYISRKYNKDGE